MADKTIFKGDNTASFGGDYLTIKVKNEHLFKISKLIFVVNGGIIQKPFTDEDYFQRAEILLKVNFTSEETQKLNASNVGRLVAYDEFNQQRTCFQSVSFNAQNGVICNVRRNCC